MNFLFSGGHEDIVLGQASEVAAAVPSGGYLRHLGYEVKISFAILMADIALGQPE